MTQADPDASEQHTSQTLRKSARDAYRAVFDQSPLPMLICDRVSLEVLAANELAARLHGSTPDELVGVSLFQLRRVSDLTPVMLKPASGGELSPGFGYHLKPDGSLVPVQMSVHAREFEGRPAWLCVLTSLDETLRPNEAEAKRRMFELVGRIALGTAHDLNNQLSVILSFTSLLSGQLVEPDTAQSDLGEIHEAAERATTLIRQITSLTRRNPVAPRPLPLNELVQRLDQLLRHLLDDSISLTTRLEPNLEPVLAEAGQLERLLLHLVASAGDALSAGGSIALETKNVELDNPSGLAKYVMLSVSAAPGPSVGLAVEEGARFCGAAFAAPGQIAFEMAGTAAGLAAASSIVKQSGGTFWVETDALGGARFVACLPSPS